MKQHEAVEVEAGVVFGAQRECRKGVLQRGLQIGLRCRHIGQVQVPAAIVRHLAGVVQGVGLRQARGMACMRRVACHAACALPVAANPGFLKPADMAQFPERRIALRRQGHAQLRAQCRLVRGQPGLCAGTGGAQQASQRLGTRSSGRLRSLPARARSIGQKLHVTLRHCKAP